MLTVAVVSAVLFVTVLAVLWIQMARGHDPALSKSRTTSSQPAESSSSASTGSGGTGGGTDTTSTDGIDGTDSSDGNDSDSAYSEPSGVTTRTS